MRSPFERQSVIDLSQIIAVFLGLFLLPKIEKNLHHFFTKHLPESFSSLYLHTNLFDCILVGALLYCLWKRVPLIDFFRNYKSFFFLLLFLCWTRFSLAKVDPLHLSRAQVLFFSFFTSCMCFLFTALYPFQKKISKHFHTLLVLLVIFSSLECLIGFSQFALQRPLNLPFLKEWHSLDSLLHISRPFAESYMGQILHFPESSDLILRSYGTMSHPNIFGGFLSIACFALYYLFFSFRQKLFLSVLLFVHILTLFTTFSRSSAICFATLTILFALYAIKTPKALGILLSVVFLSCGTGYILFGPAISERIRSLPVSTETVVAAHGDRIQGFLIAKEMITDDPLLGVGYRQFVNKIDAHIQKENASTERLPVHNIYLLIAAESGLIALFLFAAFLFFVLKELFAERHPIWFFFFATIVGMLIVGLFDCYPLTCFFWRMTFFSLCGAGCKMIRMQREPITNYTETT